MTDPILTAEHITKTFGDGRTLVRAVTDVSLRIAAGELVTISGPSGSGKTTLVSILGALLRPDSGTVRIDGTGITRLGEADLSRLRARTIGFVFQSFNLLEALSVRDNVLFPSQLAPGGIRAAAPRGDALLEWFGLSARRDALPHTLSGGEQQRAAIARALINEPRIIIADEPTGNLDSQTGQDVATILRDIANEQDRAVLIVTHDPRIEPMADRVFWLEDGVLHEGSAARRESTPDPAHRMSALHRNGRSG